MTTTLQSQPVATTTTAAVAAAGPPPPGTAPGVLDRRTHTLEELLLNVPDLADDASVRRRGLRQLLDWL